jgi:hypothetical protein
MDTYQTPTLSDLIGLLNTVIGEIKITRQGIHERLNKQAVSFFEVMLSKLLSIPNIVELKSENLIERIIILDSTIIELPKQLAKLFRGCGGLASKSAIKIQFYYDIKSGCFSYEFQEAVNPDNKYKNNFVEALNENDLIIKDLGYFNLKAFFDIDTKGAFFLSRLKSKVFIYDETGNQFNLINFLTKLHELTEIEIFIKSDESFKKVRLVVEKVPQKVKEERLWKLNKYNKKKGRQTLEEAKIYQGYNIFISNISKEILAKEDFRKFYGIRWQIELIFKNWKSNFNLDKISGFKEETIKCILYSRLILIFLTTKIIFIVRNYLWKIYSVELSEFKAAKHLKLVISQCLKTNINNLCKTFQSLLFNSVDFLSKNCKKVKQKDRTYPLDLIYSLGLA